MRYTYRIERLHRDGWVAAMEDSPGPRLAARLVRSDGRVVGEVHALTEVSIGLVAGGPSTEQLRAAAQRALDRADALEARADRRGP